MITTAGLFEQELRRLIAGAIERDMENLMSSPFDTVGGFERIRGRIEAYREVLNTVFEDAKTNLEKGLRS